MNRIIGKRAKQAQKNAKQATEAAIVSSLALPSKKQEDHRDFRRADEAKKSEIDMLREQNESIKKESETMVSEVRREHHIDRVKLHLIRAAPRYPINLTLQRKFLMGCRC